MELSALLAEMTAKNATDLHLVAGLSPIFRINGSLVPQAGPDKTSQMLADGDVEALLSPYLTEEQKTAAALRDVTFSLRQGTAAFRGQLFRERGRLAAALRVVPQRIPTLDELRLPPILETLTQTRRGLILVTGRTGSGKSTTAAAMIDHINMHRSERIITIEDPIEYEFQSKLSLISQRQVGEDVESYEQGVLSALNSDLDVALIGALRSAETVRLALVLAETGHLVFSTLGVETASEAVQRLVEVFPEPHGPIRRLLANNLRAVIAQTLLPRDTGGRAAVNEILVVTPRVRQMILEGHTDLTVAIEAGRGDRMQTRDDAIVALYRAGEISHDVAESRMEDSGRLSRPQD